jgi:hypothetical protein
MRALGTLIAAIAVAVALLAVAPGAGACAGPCQVADYDGDGINDWADNCPLSSNISQRDTDKDTPPALVEVKQPSGAPVNPVVSFDSATRVYPQTPYQAGQPLPTDMPPDKGGDACDDDDDGDGVKDRRRNGKPPDNCPLTPNPDQADADGDGVGDACDDANAVAAAPAASPAPGAPARVRTRPPRALRFGEMALGITVPVSCTARCQVAGELVLDRHTARRLRLARGLRSLVVGRGSAFLDGRGTTYLFVKVPARSLRRLARAFRRIRPVLRLSAQGAVVSTRRITLRR